MSASAPSRRYRRNESLQENDFVLEVERLFKDFRIGMLRQDNGLSQYGFDLRIEELEKRVLAFLQGTL